MPVMAQSEISKLSGGMSLVLKVPHFMFDALQLFSTKQEI